MAPKRTAGGFREVQRFSQWWVWLMIIGIAILQWYAFWVQIVRGIPFGDNPGPDWMIILFAVLFGICVPWLMWVSRLVTEVQPDALYVQLFPFMLTPQRIEFDSIAACSAGKYNPIRDYGGWGIRYGRDGKAFNVSGNMGVRLEFHDGKPLLIGSQHPVEFAEVIQARMQQ